MNARVRLSAWAAAPAAVRCLAVAGVPRPSHTERAPWPAKPPASSSTLTNSSTCAAWSAPRPRPRPWPSAPASSCAVPAPPRPPTRRSPPNSAAPWTPSPSGAAASAGTAWPDWPTARAAAARSLFPPEDRHKVLVLATTKPADLGVPTSHWSLEDLAYHILHDAHYRDMSRSTVQRILAEADLKPHKSRYWLHSDDPDF